MLSNDALNAALPLTEMLDARKLLLEPIPGTPLEALVRATRSDPEMNVNSVDGYQPCLGTIEYICNVPDPTLKCTAHDLAMDDVADVAIRSLQQHIAFAKGVVAPSVEALVNDTMSTLKDMTPSSLLGMEVIVWTPPVPMLNTAFGTSVRRFEETPFDNPSLNMRLPNLSGQEIIEQMKTGTAGLDKDIAEWAASKGESFFLNIWENVFQQKQAGQNDKAVSFQDYIQNRESGMENAVAIYLLSRRLTDAPLNGTEMNLTAYDRLIVEFRNQAGARLCHMLDEITSSEKLGVLVRSNTHKTTVVNGNVYSKWLENGGSNEILFGNLLEQPCATTVDLINAKSGHLKALWDRSSLLTATVESNRRFNRTKEVLLRHFQKQVMEIDEKVDGMGVDRPRILKLFNDGLDSVSEDDVKDLWGTCLKLVCRSRFYRTDAEMILGGIERVKRENPSIDIREAAAVSVAEYAAYWVSTQFKVISG